MKVLNSAEQQAAKQHAHATYTPAYLATWRQQCDPLADAVVASIAADARGVVPAGHSDLLSACEAAAEAGDEASVAFLREIHHVPAWVDLASFQDGIDLFRRNGIITFLIGISVLMSSYGGYKDNKVLVLSNRLGEGDSFRRAVETAQFTLDVTAQDGMRINGIGWRAIVQVRLLHARVRQFARRGGFPVARYDEPINQEAMCGAIMLFSHGVVRALEMLGVQVSDKEKASYHALWRYAGWLMGVDLALLPEHHAGEVALFDLHQYDYQPDEDTNRLFDGTLNGIVNGARTLPFWMVMLGGLFLRSPAFIKSFVGYTVNDKLRAYLQLFPSWRWQLFFVLLQVVLRAVSVAQRRMPRFGRISLRLQSWLMQQMVTTLSDGKPVAFNNTGLLA